MARGRARLDKLAPSYRYFCLDVLVEGRCMDKGKHPPYIGSPQLTQALPIAFASFHSAFRCAAELIILGMDNCAPSR